MPFGYRLRKPWFDGRTEIVFDPIVFLRRLAALIPAPYTNLVRYHGIFANRSRFRDRLPPPPAADDVQKPPPGDDGTTPEVEDDGADVSPHRKRPRRLAWAHLLRRVLDIDVLTCPKCDANMVIIAFLTDSNVLTKILDHLKLPSTPPTLGPARSSFDDQDLFAEEELAESAEPAHRESPGLYDGMPTARAPP